MITNLQGKVIEKLEITKQYCGTIFGAELTFTDGSKLTMGVGTVNFDQYSSTPVLELNGTHHLNTPEEEALVRKVVKKKK